MKKLLLTMASLVMLASASFAQDEPTPMLPSQHGLTDHQPAWGNTQSFELNAGWNWWSTYINVSDIETLENALGSNATDIKSKNEYVSNDGSGWVGTLSTIENDVMYVIKMTEASTFQLSGSRANPSAVAIPISAGWNWVGYPATFPMTVAYALSGYENPSDSETFKDQYNFAQYDAETGQWMGTLTGDGVYIQPGNGYKMLSYKENYSFYYPSVPEETGRFVSSQNVSTTEWKPVMASNPTNMNMIAFVTLGDEELRGQDVEIGVFNGETCRGAVRPMYVEPFDRYLVFLTMYGEENEPFRFRMLDHETGAIYESNEVSVSYKADDIVGALRSPFELKFNTNASNMTAGILQLFPNPVNHGESVNMTLPEGSSTVEIINTLGSIMKTERVTQGSSKLAVDMAPGIYTVKVTNAQGNVFVDKLVVK